MIEPPPNTQKINIFISHSHHMKYHIHCRPSRLTTETPQISTITNDSIIEPPSDKLLPHFSISSVSSSSLYNPPRMLHTKYFHGLYLVVILFHQHPELCIPLLLLRLILVITPTGRRRDMWAGVTPRLEDLIDTSPMGGEGGGGLRPVLVG
mmetsp:Transcript_23798/g.49306  ORF Transcript_23798/g.49306 Transcript_23798/m.49306 type:complete len:151 (-) Transcript_23798:833-1285(-)